MNNSDIIPTATIYVNKVAEGNNNGTSLANAYTNLQSATGAAALKQGIWVAAGTYSPTASPDATVPDGTGLTTVYTNANYAPTTGGFDMLTLQTPFTWNGTI
jgi:hypothetical protein